MKYFSIEASTRDDSSTLMALESVIQGKQDFSSEVWRIKDKGFPLFRDTRSGGDWALTTEVELAYDKMREADHIILASPLYWYSVSHLMKNFLDHWTYYLRHPRYPMKDAMKGKCFSYLIVGSGEKNHLIKPVFDSLRYSVDYIGGVSKDEWYFTEKEARAL